ncbi:MAG: hypothetical protein AB2375_02830 [Tissierellaceae bacterium]
MYKKRLIICIILLILTIGCAKDNQNVQLNKKDKAPQSLQDLSEGLDKLLEGVGNIERIELEIDDMDSKNKKDDKEENKKEGDQEGQNGGGDKQSQQGGTGNSNQSSSGSNDREPKQQMGKPEKLKETWDSIDKNLEKIHSFWDAYEVDRIKKGGTTETGVEFESSINKMTKAVENRNIIDIYDYGSQCYLNLKTFYDLYTDEYKGEVSKIKYMVYRYYLGSLTGNKEEVVKALKDKDESINKIRIKLEKDGNDEKEKMEELDKVAAGLRGLENTLEEDSKRLSIIKKDTIIKSLKLLE